MKPLLLVILVLSAIGSTAGSSTAAAGVRDEVQTYSAPHGFDLGPTRGSWSIGIRFLEFDARKGERSVRFELRDTFDGAVGGRTAIDSDGDGDFDQDHYFCGRSKKLPVHPQGEIYLAIVVGACPGASSVTMPTQGTATASFSR